MTFSSQEFESFVPVYDTVPEKWEDARQFLVEHLKKISNAVNIREIGFFLDEELLSGKQFIPTVAMSGPNSGNSQQFRSVLRKVIDFGALPAAGNKAIAHGINFDSNFTLIQLFAAATDPIGLIAIPIPWAEVPSVPPGNIRVYLDATNVNITVESNRSNFTRCFVVIEYIQEI